MSKSAAVILCSGKRADPSAQIAPTGGVEPFNTLAMRLNHSVDCVNVLFDGKASFGAPLDDPHTEVGPSVSEV